jgi:hypothetical protein
MNNLLRDIIKDPREYLPVLIILAALFVFWAGLCVSGVVSIRAATRRRRFWLAIGPLVFGFMGVLAQMPFSLEAEGFRLSFDFRWLFVIPLLLGVAGLACWWQARPKFEP